MHKPISDDALAQRLNRMTKSDGWEMGEAYYCIFPSADAAESVAKLLDANNILCEVNDRSVSVPFTERQNILRVKHYAIGSPADGAVTAIEPDAINVHPQKTETKMEPKRVRNGEIINQLASLSGVGWTIVGAKFISTPMNATQETAFRTLVSNTEICVEEPARVPRGAVFTMPYDLAIPFLAQHRLEQQR